MKRSFKTNAVARSAAHQTHASDASGQHPRVVPTLEPDVVPVADQPFEEGARDAIDPDLRHRLISETAFRLARERGFEEGYEDEDWQSAEAMVEHQLLKPGETAE